MADTVGSVLPMLKDVPGLSGLAVTNVTKTATKIEAKTTLNGKPVTVLGFKVSGTNLGAVVPGDFHLTDIMPIPQGSPIDGVTFKDVAFVYAPAGTKSLGVYAKAFPDAVKKAIEHIGDKTTVTAGLNLFGAADFGSSGTVKQVLQTVGLNTFSLPLNATFPSTLFQHDPKSASQGVKDQLLADLNLNLALPTLHVPGLPSAIRIKNADFKIVAPQVKGKTARDVYAGVTGDLEAKLAGKTLDMDFYVLAEKPGSGSNTVTLRGDADSKTSVKVGSYTLTGLNLVAEKKSGTWSAGIDAKATINGKPVEIAATVPSSGASVLTITSRMTLAELTSLNVPGLTDFALTDIVIGDGTLQAQAKIKSMAVDIATFKHGGKTLIAVSTPASIHISDLIPQIGTTPLDSVSFDSMTYVWAPQGTAAAKIQTSALPKTVSAVATKSASDFDLKAGLNVIGTLAIQQNGDLGKMLSAVGAYKSSLPLTGTLSPKVFEKGNASQLKNDILDSLDLKLPLQVSGLHLPSQVQLKGADLEIKGVNANGQRGIETVVTGELDAATHNEKLAFDFDVDVKKPSGKPSEVVVSGKTKPGTKLTVPLLSSFSVTDLEFTMTETNAKWTWQIDGKSQLRNKPVDVVYGLLPNGDPALAITTKMTLADAIDSPGLPGLDDVELDSVGIFKTYLDLKMKVKGVDSTVMVYKQSGVQKRMLAFLTGNFSPGDFVPGAANTPLKDAQFNGLTFNYNPASQPTRFDTNSVPSVGSWLKNIAKVESPTLKPGLNVFGALIVHPSGEIASLLKQVGVSDLNLPLNGSFSPKVFSSGAASIKNELLAALDIQAPLPNLKLPGTSGGVNVQNAAIHVTGKDAKGNPALTVDVAGRLDFTHGSSKADFDFDVDLVKKSGKDTVEITAKEVPGTKLTIDMLEKFELTDMSLKMEKASGDTWSVQISADSKIGSKPVNIVFNRVPGKPDFLEIVTKLTLAEAVDSPGLPGLDDVELDSISFVETYTEIKMKVKGVDSTVMVYKQPGLSKHTLAFLTGNFSPADLIPGAENTPLKDTQFNGLTFIYNPGSQPTQFDTNSVPSVGSWLKNIAKVESPTLKPGLNVFGALIVHPQGKMKALLKDVGVSSVNIPLDGALSPKAFSANPATVKNEILDALDINVNLPPLKIPDVDKYLTFKNEHLEIKGKLPDGSPGLSVKIAADGDVKVKNEDLAFTIQVDYDRSQGAAATDLEIKGQTDKPWNKPFGISFLDLQDLTLDIKKQKDASGQRTYDLDMAAKTDIGRNSKLDVEVDVHETNGQVTDAVFELDGPLNLSDIPDVKDIPEAGNFKIDTIKISEHGIEAKTDFGKNKDLDVYLFTGSGWNLILRQDNFAITEFVPPLASTPLQHIKLSEAAIVLSKDGLEGELSSFSPIAQDALKDIYGATTASVKVDQGLSLISAFEHKNAGGGLSDALKRLGLAEERVVLTGDIGGLFGGPTKLDVDVVLNANPGAAHQPTWMKSKPGVEAVFSLIATESDGQFDVEIGIGTDVTANMHGTELDFTAKTALEFEDEKIDVKIVADLKDTKGWKKPFGIPGLTVYEVGLDFGIDVEGAVHFGFVGNTKISNDDYKLAFDADLEGGVLPTDIALVASADEVDIFFIEEIAVAMLGGGFSLDIPQNVFPTFSAVKFAFATPGASDPDLGITGVGFGMSGAMDWLGHKDLGQMKVSINPTSGIAASGDIADITLGNVLTLKNNNFDLKANIKSVPSLKVNGDIDVLGINDTVEVAVDKKGILFKSSLSDGPSLKADIDFNVKYDVSAKKPDFKNADIFMSGDLTLDLKKFIEGPAESALNAVFSDLNSGFATAETALKNAQSSVDTLTTKLNAARAKVRAERAKVEARVQNAENRVNSLKSTISDDWGHYHGCSGWGKYICKAKWAIKIGFEKGGLAAADFALTLAKELVAHFPIDLDPTVAELIVERDTAKGILDLAEEAVKGLDFVTKFKNEADSILNDMASAANVSITKASFEGDLKAVIGGGPVDLALEVDLWGKTLGDSFAFYLKDIGTDVEHLAMMGYYALDHLVNNVLSDLPGALTHKLRGLIGSGMDSVDAAHKRRLAQFSTQFAKYHQQADDIQTALENYNTAYIQEQLSNTSSPLDSDTSESFTAELIEVGHTGLCLSTNNGQVQQQACNGNAAEKWSTKPVDGAPNVKPKAGYVNITNAAGDCIVPEGTWQTVQTPFTDGSQPPGFSFGETTFKGDGKLNVTACKNLKEFYWKVLQHGDAWVMIANLASNQCLHFTDSSAQPGTASAEWKACVGSANQVFRVADSTTPKYYAANIALKNDGQSVCFSDPNSDGHITAVNCTKGARYDYVIDVRGDIKFINRKTGNCIQPKSYTSGDILIEKPCSQLDYQWWEPVQVPGGWRIKNAQTGTCTQSPGPGANIVTATCTDSSQFVIAPVTDPNSGITYATMTNHSVPNLIFPSIPGTGAAGQIGVCTMGGFYGVTWLAGGITHQSNGEYVCWINLAGGTHHSTGSAYAVTAIDGAEWMPIGNGAIPTYAMPSGFLVDKTGLNGLKTTYTCRARITGNSGKPITRVGWTTDLAPHPAVCTMEYYGAHVTKDFQVLARQASKAYQLDLGDLKPGGSQADKKKPTVIVDNSGNVETYKWTLASGTSKDIGAGADGSIWNVSVQPEPAGYSVWRNVGGTWEQIQTGGAVRIDVDPQGNAWIVQSNGMIWKWTGSGWTRIPGPAAKDIGVGADGKVWMVGGKSMGDGWQVHRRDGNNWTPIAGGGAVAIDVDPSGNAWIVQQDGKIWRWDNKWIEMPGSARDIAAGPGPTIVGLTKDDGVPYKWTGSEWSKMGLGNALGVVTVDAQGRAWAAKADGGQTWVWRLAP